MLTLEHLKIYYRYGGDIDGWARSGSKKEKAIMSDDAWSLIDIFQQDLELINKGLASQDFKGKVMEELKKHADKETQEYLLENKKPKSDSIFKRLFG